jgi:hypothetical protein
VSNSLSSPSRVEQATVVDEFGDAVFVDPAGRRRVAHCSGRVKSAALSVVVPAGYGPSEHGRKLSTETILETPILPAE